MILFVSRNLNFYSFVVVFFFFFVTSFLISSHWFFSGVIATELGRHLSFIAVLWVVCIYSFFTPKAKKPRNTKNKIQNKTENENIQKKATIEVNSFIHENHSHISVIFISSLITPLKTIPLIFSTIVPFDVINILNFCIISCTHQAFTMCVCDCNRLCRS